VLVDTYSFKAVYDVIMVSSADPAKSYKCSFMRRGYRKAGTISWDTADSGGSNPTCGESNQGGIFTTPTAITTDTKTLTVNGATDSGTGWIRLSFTGAHGLSAGEWIEVASVGGVSEATGTWSVAIVNSTTVDLINSAFGAGHTYTSGGTASQQRIVFNLAGPSSGGTADVTVFGQLLLSGW
jgi:hypothetical protein